MGMDNRKGAFWLQLHEHYKRNGYVATDDNSDDSSSSSSFDPAQFSLCYDRQPLSMDLTTGVGSGTLTLGGTDPLLHNTEMVYAQNIAPKEGWYTVRVRAMFLRTRGGTLSEGPFVRDGEDAQEAVEYVRVKAKESALNGQLSKERGVIVDSGTTDTYLPQSVKAEFDAAWKAATGDDGTYHNNAIEMTPEQMKSLPTILIVLQGHPSNDDGSTAIGMTRSHEAMFKEVVVEGEDSLEAVSDSDVIVAIPPTHYMEESHQEPGKYTARVYFTERFGAQSILGSNILMGHEVNFDVGRGRIGIAESHCNYETYVQERDAQLQQGGGEGAGGQQEQQVAPAEVAMEEAGATAEGGDAAAEEQSVGGDLAASGWALR